MLTVELAKAIVDKLMSVLGKNINLMDERGVIIASGSPDRVGTLHEGAAHAIEQKKTFEIWANDVCEMQGVLPGINVPIKFEERVVGAVGITGEPDDVRNYAQLIRYTTELMLEQSSLKEQFHMQERAREIYLQDLLSGNWGSDQDLFIHRGSLFNLDLKLPRTAVTFQLSAKYGYTGATSSLIQHHMNRVIAASKSCFSQPDQLSGFTGAGHFVILSLEKPDRLLRSSIEQTLSLIQYDEGGKVIVGIGNTGCGLEGFRQSYEQSLAAIKLGQIFYPNKQVFYYNRLQVEDAVFGINAEFRVNLYRSILGSLLNNEDGDGGNRYNAELLYTLEQFYLQGMSLQKTAKALFLHRNTLTHRLNKIKALTGLDPKSFVDAFKLKLALLCYRLDKRL